MSLVKRVAKVSTDHHVVVHWIRWRERRRARGIITDPYWGYGRAVEREL